MDNSNTDIVSEAERFLGPVGTDSSTNTNTDATTTADVKNHKVYDNSSQYHKRNVLYNRMLRDYFKNFNKNSKRNISLKTAYFWFVMSLFAVIILASFYIVITLTFEDNFNSSHTSILTGAITSIISSIIILPRVIAKYLFPLNETKNMLDLLEKMQTNDLENKQLEAIIYYQNTSVLSNNNSEPSDN